MKMNLNKSMVNSVKLNNYIITVKKYLLLTMIMMLGIIGQAQDFKYKAKINEIPKTGFYKLELSTEVIARAMPNLMDLRIIDNKGKEVPYIFTKETISTSDQHFHLFPIEMNNSAGNDQMVIIGNPKGEAIDNIVVEMKNAIGDKKIRIKGSDDNKNWYMVHQGTTFTLPGTDNNVTIFKAINFPKTDYKYFSIEFLDSVAMPLNILRIGHYANKVTYGNYVSIPNTSFTKKDSSDKKTYVQIVLPYPNLIDKIKFTITKPEQYLRSGEIYFKSVISEVENPTLRKERITQYNLSTSFELNSEQDNIFNFNNDSKTGVVNIVIDNKDNEPLEISSIELMQLGSFITAKLEKGRTCYLQFGDSTLNGPEYDLQYFENKIPHDIPVIHHDAVQVRTAKDIRKEKQNDNRLYVWIGLGLAGILLAFMTNKMLREIKK